MLIIISGEGPSDMGSCVATDPCEGDAFRPGPMAWLVNQIAESRLDFSFLELGLLSFVSKQRVTEVAKGLRPPTLAGRKRKQETAYYFRNARAFARIAVELSGQAGDDVVAVLFRDADGTQSAGRGHWQDKWTSMENGFAHERFYSGVPMIPKPKSEAWLLCALKQSQPYQDCARIEQMSGNDDAPNSLKELLVRALGEPATAVLLSERVRDGTVNAGRIDMPSFVAFRERLQSVL